MAPASVTRGQLFMAQFGPRPNKNKSLAMLLGESDLPGTGWFMRSERVFRLGKLGKQTPAGQRAGKAGLFAAVRSFEQSSSNTWVISQVFPFVSAEDASLAVPNWSMDNMWGNPKYQGELVEHRELLNMSVPQVDALRIIQHDTKSPTGRGYQYLVLASIGSVAFFIGVSRVDFPVPMEEVIPVVIAQASKLSE